MEEWTSEKENFEVTDNNYVFDKCMVEQTPKKIEKECEQRYKGV
jgi:hypothetical protein